MLDGSKSDFVPMGRERFSSSIHVSPVTLGKMGQRKRRDFQLQSLEPEQGSTIRNSLQSCNLLNDRSPGAKASSRKVAPRHHLEASDVKLVALQDMGLDPDDFWSWREHSCAGMNETLPSELAWPVSALATRYPSALYCG